MQALPPPGGFIPRTHHTKGGHTQTHPDRHTHFILSSTRCTLLHTLTRTLYTHTHTQMHTLLVVNETHSPEPISSTLRHHVHISLTHHPHVTHILSPRQHPEWNPRPEERSRQRSKCKTQSLRSVGPEAVPDQWFGLNSSGYFPNNSSLCPNSPSSVACPATWSLILLLAFLFLHAGCVRREGTGCMESQGEVQFIFPRHLPPERRGVWGFNVCRELQLPPIHMPGVTILDKKSPDLFHQLCICSHRHHCSIHTTYRYLHPYVLIHPLDTHHSIDTHTKT